MKTLPDPNYVVKQRDFQWKMRSILIDWLVEVHHKFKLLPVRLDYSRATHSINFLHARPFIGNPLSRRQHH